jgi:hypothetical protein
MTFILGLGLQQGISVWEQGISSANWNLEQKRGGIFENESFVLYFYCKNCFYLACGAR